MVVDLTNRFCVSPARPPYSHVFTLLDVEIAILQSLHHAHIAAFRQVMRFAISHSRRSCHFAESLSQYLHARGTAPKEIKANIILPVPRSANTFVARSAPEVLRRDAPADMCSLANVWKQARRERENGGSHYDHHRLCLR
jgi:hypothetical protein